VEGTLQVLNGIKNSPHCLQEQLLREKLKKHKFEALEFYMKKSIIFVIIVLFTLGCRKEPVSWDVDAFFPILTTKMSLQQAVPDSLIAIGPNQELNLIYKGTLIKFELDSLLSMPDTTIVDQFLWPVGSITLQPGQVFLSDTNYTRYNLGNAKLTQLNIASGSLKLTLTSTLQEASVMEYSLPTTTLNGIPFFIKENIPAGSASNPAVITKTYDISGYNISLTGIHDNDFNLIANSYRAYIDHAGSPVVINAGDRFTASNTMTGVTPNYARGSFGTELTNQTSSGEPIDAFKNISSGLIALESVTMQFELKNEIGVDISLNINDLTAISTANNVRVSLQSPLSNGDINLNRATESNGANSTPVSTSYRQDLNPNNSNVTEFVSTLPNQIRYDFDIHLNPLGNVSNSNDFIYDNTGLSINLDAEIPLKFNANNLILLDTSDFSIDSTSQKEALKIIGGSVNLHALNWYPFDLIAQFYLVDENNNIIDSIFDAPQTLSGATPIFGVVDDPIHSFFKAPVNESKITHLYETKNIITRINITSTDTGKIQIYEQYFIDLKIVGDFQYLISVD